jgi:hypothetical protein
MNAVISNYSPGALLALASITTTVTATGARVGMSVVATPQSDPGTGVIWNAWVSANDTVTLRLGVLVGITPNVVNWIIKVTP